MESCTYVFFTHYSITLLGTNSNNVEKNKNNSAHPPLDIHNNSEVLHFFNPDLGSTIRKKSYPILSINQVEIQLQKKTFLL